MIAASDTRRKVGAGAVHVVARTVRRAAVVLSASVFLVGAGNLEHVTCIAGPTGISVASPRHGSAVVLSRHTGVLTAGNVSYICQIYTGRIATFIGIPPFS